MTCKGSGKGNGKAGWDELYRDIRAAILGLIWRWGVGHLDGGGIIGREWSAVGRGVKMGVSGFVGSDVGIGRVRVVGGSVEMGESSFVGRGVIGYGDGASELRYSLAVITEAPESETSSGSTGFFLTGMPDGRYAEGFGRSYRRDKEAALGGIIKVGGGEAARGVVDFEGKRGRSAT